MPKPYDLEMVCAKIAKKRDIQLQSIMVQDFFKEDNIKKYFAPYKSSLSEENPNITTLMGKDDQFFFGYYGNMISEDRAKTEVLYIEDDNRRIIVCRNVASFNDYLIIKNKDYLEALNCKEVGDFFSENDFVHSIELQTRPKNKPLYILLESIIEDRITEKTKEKKKYSFKFPYRKKEKKI